MPIDASIIGGLQAPKIDPLAMTGELMGIRSSMLNNQLLQQKYAGTSALGTAMQGAIDPQTGKFNPDAANTAMAGLSGDAVSMVPQGVADTQVQRQAQLTQQIQEAQLPREQLATASDFFGKIQDAAGGLLGLKGPDGKPLQLNAKNVGQHMAATLTPVIGKTPQGVDMMVDFLTNLPNSSNPVSDDAAIRQKISNIYLGAGASQATIDSHIANLKGPVQLVPTGGGTQPVQISTLTGEGGPIGASVPNTLPPAVAAQPTPVVDQATGRPGSVPLGSIRTATGGAAPNIPGLTDANGVTATGMLPGAKEARTAVGEGSGAQYAGDLAASPTTQNSIVVLKKLQSLLEAPEGKTGPSTQTVNGMRNFLLGNIPQLTKFIPGGLTEAQVQSATQDQIKKYMVQSAAAAAAQYGSGTNEKLAIAASGNPNPDMSNLANRDVTMMNLALARAQQGRLASFQATGLPAEQYSTWASNWNRQVDPRAFMLDVLPAAERAKMLKSVTTPAAKAAMLAGKRAAVQAGLFQDSDIPR